VGVRAARGSAVAVPRVLAALAQQVARGVAIEKDNRRVTIS
jgi:hypothetical protein